MTMIQLERRLKKLEDAFEQWKSTGPKRTGAWWANHASPMQDDPVFADVIKRGRRYRESLKPRRRKRAK